MPKIDSPRQRFYLKCFAVSFALVTVITIPFLLFGDEFVRWCQGLLSKEHAPEVISILVILLLVSDIVLPIPSSLVCVSAFVLLDPALAFFSVTAGLTITYFVGHVIGANAGRPLINLAFSPDEQLRLKNLALNKRYAVIVMSRPLPVLAEATSLYFGSIGTPLLPATLCALLSSIGLAGMYAWIARAAQSQEEFWLSLLASIVLPGLFWFASKFIQRRNRG